MPMLFDKVLQDAYDVVDGKEVTNKYVKRQCEWFLSDLERQDSDDFAFFFDQEAVATVEGICELLNVATGVGVVGTTVLESTVGFQAFFLVNVYGERINSNPSK